jgi:hypothetical protein
MMRTPSHGGYYGHPRYGGPPVRPWPRPDSMKKALYDALYVDQAPFVWVHLTQHGWVRGESSPAALGRNFQA